MRIAETILQLSEIAPLGEDDGGAAACPGDPGSLVRLIPITT
jgi:hypothetical protein